MKDRSEDRTARTFDLSNLSLNAGTHSGVRAVFTDVTGMSGGGCHSKRAATGRGHTERSDTGRR